MTKSGFDLIKHYESLHDGDLSQIGLQPKMDCLGIWTEGWGAAIYDSENRIVKGAANKSKAYEFSKIKTEAQAEADLIAKVSRIESAVRSYFNPKVFFTDNEVSAITCFSYNCGLGALKGSTLLRKLNMGDRGRIDEILNWDKGQDANGKMIQLPGLTARRKSEKYLFETGVFLSYNG